MENDFVLAEMENNISEQEKKYKKNLSEERQEIFEDVKKYIEKEYLNNQKNPPIGDRSNSL